ncbi:hypothetical protein MycrhDRAFT_6890 [Mycolicibacterium rhodesiae JS60]|nr:hypothetical protein MycrhDRAFT_6890 [Mycolicibacterium rhodesiae JS60]
MAKILTLGGFSNPALWAIFDPASSTLDGEQYTLIPTSSYWSMRSANSYDLTESHLSVKLAQNANAGNGSITTYFGATAGSDNDVSFRLEGGTSGLLGFIETVDGSESSTDITYNPAVHVWFRLRHSGTTVYWETSADGTSWAVQRSKTAAINLTSVDVFFASGYWDTEPSPGSAIFEDLNPDGGPRAHLFADTFADLDQWYSPGTATVENNMLKLTPAWDYDYLFTLGEWDLTGSHFLMELVQNANRGDYEYGSSITTEIYTRSDSDNQFGFMIYGGSDGSQIELRHRVAGVDSDTSMFYNESKHRWFRMRESEGTIYWETSYNGASWSIHRSAPTSFDLTEVTLHMVVGYWYEGETDPGYTLIGNINLGNDHLLPQMGWFVGNTLPFGGLDGGTVQSRNYFEAADWLWDPIPDNPVLDPLSTEIGALLTTDVPGQHHSVAWGWYGNSMVHPHQVTPSTPRYQIEWLGWDLHPTWWPPGTPPPWESFEMPIPLGTQVPPGSDGHLVVADPVSGKVFGLWQAAYDEGTDTWSATWGGITDLHGDGRDYNGSSTASQLSRYAAVIRISELQAGEIPHALFCASNMCKPTTFRYPAQKTDGDNAAGVLYPVEQGSRLQLDPTIDLAAIPNITPIELAIGRAWQKYGCYVGDKGGNPSPPSMGGGAVELWQGQDYTIHTEGEDDIPVPPPYAALGVTWDYFGLDHIPWVGNIRVLKNWDGT